MKTIVTGVPREAYGDAPYYTDWMDTEESQRLLRYQRHDFAGFQRDVHARLARVRPWLRLVRAPIRWWMLRQGGRAHA